MTRAGCHLCDEMEAVLERVLPSLGLAWDRLDVDGDERLRLRYGEVVPVLLRDGVPVAKVRTNRDQLVRLVERRR